MRREFSAGGLVYKREITPKRNQTRKNAQSLRWLVVQHSQHKGWVFPKGLIGDKKISNIKYQKSKIREEIKESIEEAALREVREEGGVIARIIAAIPQTIEYWYQFQGEKILKKVYYYLMEYVAGNVTDHDDEVSAVEWLSTDEVNKRLTYNNDKKVFQSALAALQKSKQGEKKERCRSG